MFVIEDFFALRGQEGFHVGQKRSYRSIGCVHCHAMKIKIENRAVTQGARGFSCAVSGVCLVCIAESDFFDGAEPMTSQFKSVSSRIWTRKLIGS